MGLLMLYVAVRQQLHISSTRRDHCQTCHQTILLAYRLKIIRVGLQPQRNNKLDIIRSSHDHS